MNETKTRFTHFVVAAFIGFFGGMFLMLLMQTGHTQNLSKVIRVSPPTRSVSSSSVKSVDIVPKNREAFSKLEQESKVDSGDFSSLSQRNLTFPLEGLTLGKTRDTFNEDRGTHIHEAVDILAPRNTHIIAVEDGTIAKLWFSKYGGNTIYQFDPSKQYAYYYAHLERYADGLKEGDHVKRGQLIGYVGTSGNAPPDTPHLHFTIFKLSAEKVWWKGTAINPYPLYAKK